MGKGFLPDGVPALLYLKSALILKSLDLLGNEQWMECLCKIIISPTLASRKTGL